MRATPEAYNYDYDGRPPVGEDKLLAALQREHPGRDKENGTSMPGDKGLMPSVAVID